MGACAVLVTLLLPMTVLCMIPPSPVLPGLGPVSDDPPPIIPIDHQRCVAMRKETRHVKVPIPFFCHPRDAKGIPIPQVMDKRTTMAIMRLQWSGYRVCTRQVPMPTHRYVPVPICCPGWRRGPTGKCDTLSFNTPPALRGPCLNGGIVKKNGKCCLCPPGFTGPLCQHTTPPTSPGRALPFPSPRKPPMAAVPRRSPPMDSIPAAIRSQIRQFLGSRRGRPMMDRTAPRNRPLPISPSLLRFLTGKPTQTSTDIYMGRNNNKASPPRNTAYINQLPQRPTRPAKPVVNTASINRLPPQYQSRPRIPQQTAFFNRIPQRNMPRQVPVNVAYINRLVPRRIVRPPINTASINQLVIPRPLRITVNTAHINRLPRINPNRPTVNTAVINQVPSGRGRPVQPPAQTAHINRVPEIPVVDLEPARPVIRTNSPQPVMAPPLVLAPRVEIPPIVQPADDSQNPSQSGEDRGDKSPVPQPSPQARPGPRGRPQVGPSQNMPSVASNDQCKQIIEVGVTRCFRDAGILAAPSDVFNPQNPDVARRICSQGGRLRPCIMAGETACGRGMRVIITRRMLTSLLTAMGSLCTSQSRRPPLRKICMNGGQAVYKDGNYVCECPQGFGGEMCEMPICIPACENNGMCENIDGAPKCVCMSGFYGDQCEDVVAVTTVTDPKPVDPPTHTLETSSSPVSVLVEQQINEKPKESSHEPSTEELSHDSHLTKTEIFGYPLWFVLAIALGFFVFLLVIFITCCMCIKMRRTKRSFEVTKEVVKLPPIDNVYTVGTIPAIYEAKGIPPLSYEEAKGETIKGLEKTLEKKDEDEDCKSEEN